MKLIALLAAATLTATGFAAPLTDAEVQAAVEAYTNASKAAQNAPDRETYMKQIKEAAEAAVGKMDISEATIDQLEQLRGPLNMCEAQKTNLQSRLGALAPAPTAEGARATLMQMQFNDKPSADDVLNVFNHAGMTDALKAGKGSSVFGLLSKNRMTYSSYDKAKLTAALDKTLNVDIPASGVAQTSQVFEFLNADKNGADAAMIQKYRALIDGKFTAAMASNTDEALTPRLKSMHAYLDGAYAKGTLLNNTAPEINFKWTNSPTEIKTLADLKGKVVVVDFWATWCGPCIGSFPQVRELVAEYKNYPVVVLGVTSIQGSVSFPKATEKADKRIDCKSDEAKELSLLPKFISDMEMTWTVGVSNQDVFNPDFGVRGIPHVAIIDPAGKVRYRGLHPAMDHEKEAQYINELLKEFKLPCPESESKSTETKAEPKAAPTK